MPFDMHTIETVDGATPTNRSDRLLLAFLPAVPNAAGGSAGASVNVVVSGLTLPPVYVVHAQPSSAVVASVNPSSMTASGFTVVLTPLSSSATVAAGSVGIMVFG
jgi:hypothetical protein